MNFLVFMSQGKTLIGRVVKFFNEDIWVRDDSKNIFQRIFYNISRIIVLTVEGVFSNRILSQAASLSYVSIITIGPLIALTIMVGGFVLDKKDGSGDKMITDTITQIIGYVAPHVSEEVESKAEGRMHIPDPDHPGETVEVTDGVNKDLVNMINAAIKSAKSGTMGVIGSLVLIFIVIKTMSTIEGTFNMVWGVRKGRPIWLKVIAYWTFITLGTILLFASIATLTVSMMERFQQFIPFMPLKMIGPVFSVLIVLCMLITFNKYIPNTKVYWMPAIIGGIIVAILLVVNSSLSFLYINKVVQTKSLYGSVGIIPLLMIGLWFFWLFLLLGSQITYAVQNAEHLWAQRIWDNQSIHTRETLCLGVYLQIARQYNNCEPAMYAEEIGRKLNVPARMVNESLQYLIDMGYVAKTTQDDQTDYYYFQPNRPLSKMTLADFHRDFMYLRSNEGADSIEKLDSIVKTFNEDMLLQTEKIQSGNSIQSLIENQDKA